MNFTRIAIHGVPRSGTTWLGEIINSSPNVVYKYQPLFSYELKGFLNEASSLIDINSFFEKLLTLKSPFLDQLQAKADGIIPVFAKAEITHIAYKEVRYHHILKNLLLKDSGIKILGVVRNPFAVMNSWLESPREFRKDLGWSEEEEWRFAEKKNCNRTEEFYGFEKWKQVAYLFHELEMLFPDRFLLVNYDNLLRDTQNQVNQIYMFCGLSLSPQTTEFLSTSRKMGKETTYSVYRRKKKDDKWKGNLNQRIITEIEKDLNGTKLEKYLMI